jgi:hypothetical protein
VQAFEVFVCPLCFEGLLCTAVERRIEENGLELYWKPKFVVPVKEYVSECAFPCSVISFCSDLKLNVINLPITSTFQ